MRKPNAAAQKKRGGSSYAAQSLFVLKGSDYNKQQTIGDERRDHPRNLVDNGPSSLTQNLQFPEKASLTSHFRTQKPRKSKAQDLSNDRCGPIYQLPKQVGYLNHATTNMVAEYNLPDASKSKNQ